MDHSIWDKISEKEFDDLLELFFEETGFEIMEKRQGKGRDGGYDYLLQAMLGVFPVSIHVQVKKYTFGKTISVSHIREFHSILEQKNYEFAWFITSSKFSNHAIDEAKKIKSLQITNGMQLLSMFQKTKKTQKKLISLIQSKTEGDPLFIIKQITDILSLLPETEKNEFMSEIVETVTKTAIKQFGLNEIYARLNIIGEVQFYFMGGYEQIGPHNIFYYYNGGDIEDEKEWWNDYMVPTMQELVANGIVGTDGCEFPCFYLKQNILTLSGKLELLMSLLECKLWTDRK